MKKFCNIIIWLWTLLFTIGAVILLIVDSVTTIYFNTDQDSDLPNIARENILLLAVGVLIFLVIVYLLAIRRDSLSRFAKGHGLNGVVQGKAYPLSRGMKAALIWCVFFGFTLILMLRGRAVNDALTLDGIVEQFMQDDFSALNPGGYLFVYPFQISYVAIGQLLQLLFGSSNYMVYQLLNLVAIVVSIYFLYQITWELFEDKTICTVFAVMSFGCLFFYIYTTLVYNDIWSIAPQMAGLYLCIRYLKYHQLKDGIGAITWNAVAIVLKSNAYISLVAIVIALVLDGIRTIDLKKDATAREQSHKLSGGKKPVVHEQNAVKTTSKTGGCLWKNLVLALAAFLLAKGMTGVIGSAYAHAAGLESMPEGVPSMTYFAMGMHENAGGGEWGWYDGYNVRTYGENGYDREATTEAAKTELTERFAFFGENPKFMVHFFLRKFVTQWSDASLMSLRNMELTARHVDGQPEIVKSMIFGTGRSVLYFVMNVYQELVMIGVVIWMASCIKRRKLSFEQAFLVLFILGGMLFHEIWEGQGRYVIRYTICFLPLAAAGVTKLLKWRATGD